MEARLKAIPGGLYATFLRQRLPGCANLWALFQSAPSGATMASGSGRCSSGSSGNLKKQRSSRLLLEDFVATRKSGFSKKGAAKNLHQELDLSKARNKALERLGLGIGAHVPLLHATRSCHRCTPHAS
eukprot:3245853-Prymnesium_polylepis.1